MHSHRNMFDRLLQHPALIEMYVRWFEQRRGPSRRIVAMKAYVEVPPEGNLVEWCYGDADRNFTNGGWYAPNRRTDCRPLGLEDD